MTDSSEIFGGGCRNHAEVALLGSDIQGLTSSNDGSEWCIKYSGITGEDIYKYALYASDTRAKKPDVLMMTNCHKDKEELIQDLKQIASRHGIRIKGVT